MVEGSGFVFWLFVCGFFFYLFRDLSGVCFLCFVSLELVVDRVFFERDVEVGRLGVVWRVELVGRLDFEVLWILVFRYYGFYFKLFFGFSNLFMFFEILLVIL